MSILISFLRPVDTIFEILLGNSPNQIMKGHLDPFLKFSIIITNTDLKNKVREPSSKQWLLLPLLI